MALVAAVEHYTAILGEWILDTPQHDAIGTDPVMLDMLRWHGAEEVEHKAVAFDVMKHLRAGYWRQVRTQLVVTPMLLLLWMRGVRFMYSVDPQRAARRQSALAGLLQRRATWFGARAAAVHPGDRRVLQAELPSVTAGRGRACGRLPRRLARRPRLPLSREELMTRTTVTASDGVTLAVHAYTEIDPQRPTVLAIHGYPDNHHLWDGVAGATSTAVTTSWRTTCVEPANRSARRAGRVTASPN